MYRDQTNQQYTCHSFHETEERELRERERRNQRRMSERESGVRGHSRGLSHLTVDTHAARFPKYPIMHLFNYHVHICAY